MIRWSLQLLLDVARLLLRGFRPSSQLARNPLVRALNVLAELGKRSGGRVRSAVLEIGRLLACFGLELVDGRALVDRLGKS